MSKCSGLWHQCIDNRAKKAQDGKYLTIHLLLETRQKGGCIALFVRINIDFEMIKRGNKCNDDIEHLAAEIVRNKGKM